MLDLILGELDFQLWILFMIQFKVFEGVSQERKTLDIKGENSYLQY